VMYENGEGTAKNIAKAIYWYKKQNTWDNLEKFKIRNKEQFM
jgi:TPR repeat protein